MAGHYAPGVPGWAGRGGPTVLAALTGRWADRGPQARGPRGPDWIMAPPHGLSRAKQQAPVEPAKAFMDAGPRPAQPTAPPSWPLAPEKGRRARSAWPACDKWQPSQTGQRLRVQGCEGPRGHSGGPAGSAVALTRVQPSSSRAQPRLVLSRVACGCVVSCTAASLSAWQAWSRSALLMH